MLLRANNGGLRPCKNRGKVWKAAQRKTETTSLSGNLQLFRMNPFPNMILHFCYWLKCILTRTAVGPRGGSIAKRRVAELFCAGAAAAECCTTVCCADPPRLGLQTHLLETASPLQLLVSLCASVFLSGCLTVCLSVCLSGWMTGYT